MLDVIAAERGTLDGLDVALPASPGSDMDAFERAGATWALWQFYPPAPAADTMKAVSAGPAGVDSTSSALGRGSGPLGAGCLWRDGPNVPEDPPEPGRGARRLLRQTLLPTLGS